MTAKEKEQQRKHIIDIAEYRKHICELRAQIAMDEREIANIELTQQLENLDKA